MEYSVRNRRRRRTSQGDLLARAPTLTYAPKGPAAAPLPIVPESSQAHAAPVKPAPMPAIVERVRAGVRARNRDR